jgi:hypothetical protein
MIITIISHDMTQLQNKIPLISFIVASYNTESSSRRYGEDTIPGYVSTTLIYFNAWTI